MLQSWPTGKACRMSIGRWGSGTGYRLVGRPSAERPRLIRPASPHRGPHKWSSLVLRCSSHCCLRSTPPTRPLLRDVGSTLLGVVASQ